jgi:putative membrane protein
MLFSFYPWLLACHILSMIAWMAGMLYLPRLYVYHASAAKGSELSETFKVMERRLLRGIMNPAMIAAFLFGGMLIAANPELAKQGWFHAKLLLVLMMAGLHGAFSKWRKVFERDENTHPPKFYRIWNEMPALLLVFIVILVVVKPF